MMLWWYSQYYSGRAELDLCVVMSTFHIETTWLFQYEIKLSEIGQCHIFIYICFHFWLHHSPEQLCYVCYNEYCCVLVWDISAAETWFVCVWVFQAFLFGFCFVFCSLFNLFPFSYLYNAFHSKSMYNLKHLHNFPGSV